MWLFNAFWGQAEFYFSIIIRLLEACLLGGIIGFEREHLHRPAGFRTHILVCVGSALVMITSEFIYKKFSPNVNVDPARLGAQVISGIGFLGAGTIIKEGINVKGLTTAASLWAVSCIGIAVGIGFYSGAFITTIIIFLTLVVIRKVQRRRSSQRDVRLCIHTLIKRGEARQLSSIIEEFGATVLDTEFVSSERDGEIILRYKIQMPNEVPLIELIEAVLCHNTVRRVYEE
ncbi:putative Mg2+ transporter-C (MgtC) family protein [Ruminiclostridium sufflavum DSM 19573]|uniref:Putative Mg2+ transporter-C (MgtC) family protein n=1 Tax=Ruminiclostridium sufflavum DSM 19573 TaxID=1121337 RepID=A0A318XNW3_9FIRM|nr:MgtC/SapB family protein [Ruminiclostridium sufflavum]PYG89446.1 putative Mg2+ transporter-C (MgtC) family protein [Ruminiclostridium sufflavum DSM 19573]